MPDTYQSAEALLVDVERQLDAVDAALLAAHPADLGEVSAGVRRIAVSFVEVLESVLSAEAFDTTFRDRIETVTHRLAMQREGLARRSALVERALASLMRPLPPSTYVIPGARALTTTH
ncbi:MAG: hypothetical protein ACRYGA_17045 [Janthinobacterium lividum]